MWSQVEADFEQMLARKIYPVLLGDAVYRAFLTLAGMGPNFPSDETVPVSLRENFAKAAKIRAHIAVAEIARSSGLEEARSNAKLITGPVTLYRFWDSRAPERREGVWWFERHVIDLCKQNAGRTAAERLEWLREHLAVSIDWSKMDRIDVMSLAANQEVPVIEGTGTAQRMYSATALTRGKVASKDYWPNLGKFFPGGVKQTVPPFLPRFQGQDLNRFLSGA
ncbi:MAG: hypothetical protein LAQ69_30075 [Acidobacteriia bacterium]|nr:hypothetical protein [Terriglobia bacterium]